MMMMSLCQLILCSCVVYLWLCILVHFVAAISVACVLRFPACLYGCFIACFYSVLSKQNDDDGE